MSKGDNSQKADDADHDDAGLDHASGHEAECDALVLPLQDRVQGNARPDDREGDDELEDDPDDHADGAAGSEDVVRVVQDRPEEGEPGDGEEGHQVQNAPGECRLAHRVRRGWSHRRLRVTGHIGLLVITCWRRYRGSAPAPRHRARAR